MTTPPYPGDRGTCRGCKAHVRWVVMAKTGKKNPLDPEPSDEGNVIVDLDTGQAETQTHEQAQLLREAGAALYISHFATCPERNRFRS